MNSTCFETAKMLVKNAVADGLIPSAALAIGQKNDIYVKETYGFTSNTEDCLPVNEKTLYDMASVTKIMSTTMITLKLLEEGKIELADTINRFLNDLVPDDKEDITIFHLMTHTSGLPSHLLLEDYIKDPKDAIRLILSRPLTAPIGSQVQYSCLGFITLGYILELITNQPLNILADQYVFSPLGMQHTSYHPIESPDCIKKYPNCTYTERDPKTQEWLAGIVHDENARFLRGISGNAGVFSNLKDCILFASMLSNLGQTTKGSFLAKATLQAAIHNYTPGMEENRGLGFHLANGYNSYSGAIFDQKAFGHTGFTGPHILISPESGLYVILLTNRVHPTRENNAQLRLRRLLHNVIAADYNKYF